MKILCIADHEEESLWTFWSNKKTNDIDLILSAGDLNPDYLEFLVTMVNVPVFYVRGNHDTKYDQKPPLGCDDIDDDLVTYKGLRILGLGGSYRYKDAKDMYTEKEMKKRIHKLKRKIKKEKGFDIFLTHAPALGYGDQDNLAHQGFDCFNDLLNEYHPTYMVHGHVHKEYGNFNRAIRHESGTIIINAYGQFRMEWPMIEIFK